jgi:hypothetical protein
MRTTLKNMKFRIFFDISVIFPRARSTVINFPKSDNSIWRKVKASGIVKRDDFGNSVKVNRVLELEKLNAHEFLNFRLL